MDENRDKTAAPDEEAQTPPAYSDAYYRQAPQTRQPSYGYSPAQHFARACVEEPEDTPRYRTVLPLALLGLVCVLMAAGIGVAGSILLSGRGAQDAAEAMSREIYEDYASAAAGEEAALPLTQGSSSELAVRTAEEIYDAACRSCVGVTIRGYARNVFGGTDTSTVSGAGIVLSEDGYILTNCHVIRSSSGADAPIAVITWDGEEYEAVIAGVEEESDIALLKIEAQALTPAELGDSDELRVGQAVYAVGNPLGELTYTMTSGIVSALSRRVTTDRGASVEMFQFDAAVNEGNSGGPLYNAFGQVVGIVTAKYTDGGAQGLSFAIPVNDARRVAEELAERGYVPGKAYLGLTLADMTPIAAKYYDTVPGVYVAAVAADSAAEAAGIVPGDIITAIDGTDVDTAASFVRLVRGSYMAGDSAALKIWREQEYMTVTVTFGEALPRPPEAAEPDTGEN